MYEVIENTSQGASDRICQTHRLTGASAKTWRDTGSELPIKTKNVEICPLTVSFMTTKKACQLSAILVCAFYLSFLFMV